MRHKDRHYLNSLDETLNHTREKITDTVFHKIQTLRTKFIELADKLIYKRPLRNALEEEQVYVRHWELRNKIESLKREITGLMPSELDYDRKSIQTTAMSYTDTTEAFLLDIQYFKDAVNEEIDYCKDEIHDEQLNGRSKTKINVLQAKIKNLENLLSIEINNKYDLDYVVWLFDNGNLRKTYEINEKKKELQSKDYDIYRGDIECSEEYDKGYHPIGLFICTMLFSPLVIGIILSFGGDGTMGYFPFYDKAYGFDFECLGANILRCYIDCAFMLYIPIWILAIVILAIYVSIHHSKFYITGKEEIKQACIAAAIGIGTAYIGREVNKKLSKPPEV